MVNKKIFLLIFASSFLVSFGFLVSATTTLVSPVANGNYSTLTFNCTTDLNEPLNATLYYNAGGGAATTALVTVLNNTDKDTEFNDSSVNIANLSDLNTYNFTCAVDNSTDIEYSASAASITIDQTAPGVNATSISGVSYSTQTMANGTFVLNVTITDTINATTVFFNLTNSSGVQDAIFYAAREGTSNNWVNSTGFNISKFTEGSYTITVYANDSANNLNSTENSGTIYFDSVSPTVSLSRTTRGATSLKLDVAITEATSGIPSSCTVDRSGASVSGTGLTQTINENSLRCGNSYSYIVTCTDGAGNQGSSVSTSFSTLACTSSSSGGTQTNQWASTYVVNSDDFEAGYSRELSKNQRMKISFGSQTHYVGVKELTSTSATIEIASNPVEVTLNVGGEKKFDFNNDGFYDISVMLLGIENNKADVNVMKINEEVSLEEKTDSSTDLEVTAGEEETEIISERESKSGLIWFLVVLVVIIIGGVVILFKDKLIEKFKKNRKVI